MSTEITTKGRIVVGTDGSERAMKAIEWAADRAVARKLPLLVSYVIAPVNWVGAMPANVAANYKSDFHDRAQAKMATIVAGLRERYPGLDVAGVVVDGHPSYVLAQATKDAELVVVGARGEHAPMTVRVLGGVTDAVSAHAHGPVAVISDEAHENPGGPVVVGVDDSPAARAAVKLAFEAAEVRGVPLVAVHGFTYARAEGSGDRSAVKPVSADYRQELIDMVNGILADEAAKHPNVPVEVRVERARPQEALEYASKDAGLVVVGSRGLGGFQGLLMGSTSKHVLRDSACPVIVTRG